MITDQELQQKAIVATAMINKILEQTGLYFGYEPDTKKIVYFDRDCYNKGLKKMTKVSVGAYNAKIASADETKKKFDDLMETIKKEYDIDNKITKADDLMNKVETMKNHAAIKELEKKEGK